MSFRFTDTRHHLYRPGAFLLGRDAQGREVGIATERHLITIAGAGSGKGAALIVPNLRRWPGSCVVVDPKGENATLTAGDRLAMGQSVGVIDPYCIATGEAASLRCSINPLALLDPASLTIRADLEALGDGMIRRFDPRHGQWDDTAAVIIAGAADFVLATCPPEERTLPSLRALLLQPDDTLKAIASDMAATATRAGLARQAGTLLLSKFTNPEGVPASAFSRTIQETGWLDDPAFAPVLAGERSFDLATLKAGTGSLYLVIPPGYLDTRGGFLRLFVRMGLMTMLRDLAGHDGSGRCLFLLDEFHSLGKMELVAKAAGLMRGYGVQLWPFLQDLGQLVDLYGAAGAETFFGNADAHIFFGNADAMTLRHISDRIGLLSAQEVGPAPVHIPHRPTSAQGVAQFFGADSQDKHRRQSAAMMGGFFSALNNLGGDMADLAAQHEMNQWREKASMVGRHRVPPERVRELVAKRDGWPVAMSMIVFGKGGDIFNLGLAPHFYTWPDPPAPAVSKLSAWLRGDMGVAERHLLKIVLLLFVLLAPWVVVSNQPSYVLLDGPRAIKLLFAALAANLSCLWFFGWRWIKEAGAHLRGS